MRVDELLNRWIVPLEKRYDFLNMSSGKKTQVPFDQLVIFSTNLQPKDLVDDAFLRRIPYKIEVPNPSELAFRKTIRDHGPQSRLAVQRRGRRALGQQTLHQHRPSHAELPSARLAAASPQLLPVQRPTDGHVPRVLRLRLR